MDKENVLTEPTSPVFLDSGQFGKVFKVFDKGLGIDVAVKEINAEIDGVKNERVFNKAFSEINTILQLHNHANIIRFHHYDVRGNTVRITTEYCQYGTLKTYLKENKNASDLRLMVSFMQQGASAIAYMHKNDPPIVHRDLKAKNILVKEEMFGHVLKIIDFGMARCYNIQESLDCNYEGKDCNYVALDVLMLGRVFRKMLEGVMNGKSENGIAG